MSRWWPGTLLLGLFCFAVYHHINPSVAYRDALPTWSKFSFTSHSNSGPWSDLEPSESLEYHPCYNGLQCARLKVPMNWKASGGVEGDDMVAIAVLRRPAKVEVTDPRYGGAIFVNPDSSEDDDGGLLFDIIGFDPRGVGYTTPKLECFPDYLSRQYWQTQGAAGEAIASTNTSFGIKLSHGSALGQSCVDRAVHHNASIAYHMNSAPVVEDMLALVERHGEWREREAFQLLGSPSNELRRREFATAGKPQSELSTALQRTKWNAGEERLLYWGVSYGTVLGQLFAHLHPERVSRLVLDAVVDTDVYLNSKWDAHIEQSDDVLDFFFDSCSRSSDCAFRDGDAQTTRARFNTLLQSLADKPIPVASNSDPTISADIVTSSDLRRVIRDAVYYPLQLFPYIDGILVDLERGNGTTLALRKQSGLRSYEQQLRRCGPDTAFDLRCHDPAAIEIDAVVSIMCSDNRVIDSMSDEDFSSYVESLQNRSHVMGWYWAEMQMPCRAWSVKPRWHVDGPLYASTAEPLCSSLATLSIQ